MQLQDSVRQIKGVGEKAERCFHRLGIDTIEDLLEHYPRSYDVYESVIPISSIREGQTVVLEVSLASSPKQKRVGSLQILSCVMKDATGKIPVTWFNSFYLRKSLKMGQHYLLRGKVTVKNGRLVMQQPKLLERQEYMNLLHKLQPVYPLTADLTNHAVTKAVAFALKETDLNGDFLPSDLRKEYDLVMHKTAVRDIHFPDDEKKYLAARKRLVFEEFFLFALAMHQMKQEKNQKPSRYPLQKGTYVDKVLQSLPFSLTEGQTKAFDDILTDVASGKVMNRLIQGDVGCGKTIISLLALLLAVDAGHQGAIMVPTEVLAKQHYESFCQFLMPLGITVGLLTGSLTAAKKREIHEQIKAHEIDIVVGTHALIQENVRFHDLAMVVTDEQHRFGVKQRETFSQKGSEPHMLVMSATPIPRTLALILYGDLDISIIEGLPQGRLPIQNCVVGTGYRPQAYRFMQKQIEQGHQVYIICPMVEDSEQMEAENVIDYTHMLREMMAPSVCVEYLHGKMKPAQKLDLMERFVRGEIDILVSTTVIEVGINVPNATVMMVENAERFGLAQLHQLRGRVGRGQAQSYCIFMTGNASTQTKERLTVLENSNDGFKVAEEDLKQRGPGDVFGIRQSGDLNFKLADIYQDAKVLQMANEAAGQFTKNDILLLCKKYQKLHDKIAVFTDTLFL